MLLTFLSCITLLYTTRSFAQTTTSCNPTEKTCSADTGLSSKTYTHDFTTGADTSAWSVTAGNVSYTSNGAEFTINQSGDAPTIRSKWYIFFGRVSFHIKAAPGTGIVSSAILESDDLDEVDWEWIGGSADSAQTNYFGKGNTTSYDRAAWVTASATQTTSHNYTIVWTESATTWYVDGVSMRTLNYADALAGKNYPQTPMDIRIGIWAGGDSSNEEGTIEWAGGETDYSDGPFTMYLEKVEVENYNPASTYTYGDLTGDYDSIKINSSGGSSSSSSSATTTTLGTAVSSGTTTGTQLASTVVPALRAQTRSSDSGKLELSAWQHTMMLLLTTVMLYVYW